MRGTPGVWVRAALGVGFLAGALLFPAVGAAAERPVHLRVCFLSTTNEEPSCATVTDSYSPPASSPPSP